MRSLTRPAAIHLVALAAWFALAALGAAQDSRPKPASKPTPQAFDSSADAKVDLAKAMAKAAADNQRVLVLFGTNLDAASTQLHAALRKNGKLSHELLYEFRYVPIDVGQMDRNVDIAASAGARLNDGGVPFLAVLTPDGKPVAGKPGAEFAVGTNPDPAKVLAFLEAARATPQNADEVYAAALKKAAAEQKTVFVHLGAPW